MVPTLFLQFVDQLDTLIVLIESQGELRSTDHSDQTRDVYWYEKVEAFAEPHWSHVKWHIEFSLARAKCDVKMKLS